MGASWGERPLVDWYEERSASPHSLAISKYRIRVGMNAAEPDYTAESDSYASIRRDARELKITGPYRIEGATREHGWITVETGTL